MAGTLQPKARVSIDKVRKGSEGYSLQLRVVKKDACADQKRFLMSFSEESTLSTDYSTQNNNTEICSPVLEEEKLDFADLVANEFNVAAMMRTDCVST